MSAPRLLNLPDGEWDGDRHVHPYVQERGTDGSVTDFENAHGETLTAEQRSEESRAMLYAIEPLMGGLSPMGLAYVVQMCTHRLYFASLGEEYADQREALDPTGDLTRFEAMHTSRLGAIADAIEEILATCPGCGSRHGDLSKGGYVHAKTGESVRLVRCEETKVTVEVDTPVRTIRRVYERDLFEAEFVRGDDVAVLSQEASA